MPSISLIAPYAPQPAVSPTAEMATPSTLALQGSTQSERGNNNGSATGQSGSGAGNGTGTGGALTLSLLRRNHVTGISNATPKSVVEARTGTDPMSSFLERQQTRQAENRAEDNARRLAEDAAAAAERRAEAKAEEEAARFEMPNPLPTAPILENRDA